jgi:hypothetical protein
MWSTSSVGNEKMLGERDRDEEPAAELSWGKTMYKDE